MIGFECALAKVKQQVIKLDSHTTSCEEILNTNHVVIAYNT